jgi:SET domain-containing protein
LNQRQLVLYKRQIGEGYVAPSWIAKVSEEAGYGLFAERDIRPGEMIGEYTGILSLKPQSDNHKLRHLNPYLFGLPFPSSLGIEAAKAGNEIRLINHSPGNPNVRRLYILQEGLLHVIYVAKKAISRNSQFLIHYGNRYGWGRPPVGLKP